MSNQAFTVLLIGGPHHGKIMIVSDIQPIIIPSDTPSEPPFEYEQKSYVTRMGLFKIATHKPTFAQRREIHGLLLKWFVSPTPISRDFDGEEIFCT